MTVAVRLSNGTVLVPLGPVRPGYGRLSEKVVESATVHATEGFAVLDPGTSEFTLEGVPQTDTVTVLLRFERIAEVDVLPAVVATEAEMATLRTQWENVDAFYRRVEDKTSRTHTPTRTVTLADVRIVDVDTDQLPITAINWTPAPEFLGLPASLTALVPGTLIEVPGLVKSRVEGTGRRVRVWDARHGQDHATCVIEFQVGFADARTRLVKKDPHNSRRNAERISVPDTKFVELHVQVPVSIAAATLDDAHTEVDRIVAGIEAQLSEPVKVCDTCSGHGLLFTNDVRERKL